MCIRIGRCVHYMENSQREEVTHKVSRGMTKILLCLKRKEMFRYICSSSSLRLADFLSACHVAAVLFGCGTRGEIETESIKLDQYCPSRGYIYIRATQIYVML